MCWEDEREAHKFEFRGTKRTIWYPLCCLPGLSPERLAQAISKASPLVVFGVFAKSVRKEPRALSSSRWGFFFAGLRVL